MTHSIVSTRDVDPAQKCGLWSKALDEIMPGLEFDPIDTSFEALLERRPRIGALRLNYVTAAPQRIIQSRRPRHSAQYGMVFLRSGHLRVRQFARTVDVHPGEFVLIDGNEPAEVVTCQHSESLNISAPASWMQLWLARPEGEVAKIFSDDMAAARPLLALLELLSSKDCPSCLGADLFANQLGGAIAIAVGDVELTGTRHAQRLFHRLQDGIASRFYDPDYSPGIAAAEAGISRRYLVSLFSMSGTTFNTELIRVRLDRSAEMLREPRFAGLSVMDVALRCGFSDASHFSKRFRARFGTSPACFRLAHSEDAVAPPRVSGLN